MPYSDPKDNLRWQRENRDKRNVIVARYRKKSDHEAFRNYDARRRYGFDSYQHLVAVRDKPCEICGQKAKKMCIDHDGPARKFNGTYRGVLCQQCNVRLGWLERYKPVIEAYLASSK
jgi:hypothetical protein